MNLFAVFSNLARNKGRTLLTIGAIAVGIFAVSLISAVSALGTEIIGRSLDDMGINSVLVEAGGSSVKLGDDDIEALATVEGINKAMPLMANITGCEMAGVRSSCMAWGVSSDADEIISLKALHGRLINDGDISAGERVCVIDKEIALLTYGRTNIVGKTALINMSGKYEQFRIVGVATSGLSGIQSAMNDVLPYFVYMPYTTVQQISGATSYDKIALLLDKKQGTDIIDTIAQCMDRRKEGEAVEVNNLLGQKSQLDGILSVITTALGFIAGVSLVVAGMSVMTAMLVSVGERRREIGIKKSLGAKNKRIVAEFLLESIVISLVGSIAGLLLSFAVTSAVCIAIGENIIIRGETVLLCTLSAVGIGMVSGSYPAYKAARMKPVDALKG